MPRCPEPSFRPARGPSYVQPVGRQQPWAAPARPGRVLRTIETNLPANRTLEMRDTQEFVAVAHQVREALREGHSYD